MVLNCRNVTILQKINIFIKIHFRIIRTEIINLFLQFLCMYALLTQRPALAHTVHSELISSQSDGGGGGVFVIGFAVTVGHLSQLNFTKF